MSEDRREQVQEEGAVAEAAAPAPAPEAAPADQVPEAADGEERAAADAEERAAADGEVSELDALRAERDEYLDLAKRAQADFENYRKRAAREAAAAGERARSGIAGELLGVLDNLERALQSAGEQEQHLAKGVELVHSELVSVLARNGVEGFDPAGERFDPELHEALSVRSEEGVESGTVLDVVERGYRLNGNVLRPARVVVSG